MKILAISDQRLPEMLRQDYLRNTYADVEFLISCGDMEPSYLEFITSALNLPLFFVRGNHDEHYVPGRPGGESLHMNYVNYRGVTMAGLEGCIHYNGKNVQYTETEMSVFALRLLPRMLVNQQTQGYGADYLVTHSPPRHIHDREDPAHRGFKTLLWFMRLAKPRYLIHGHIDVWDRRETIETQYYDTRIININPKRLLVPEQDYLEEAVTYSP
jgi:Icc-related predicted phosphoesterase